MQKRKLSFILIGTVLLITCLFPQGLAVPSNPLSPQVLHEYTLNQDTWQAGDTSAYYKVESASGEPCLLSYNSSDYVNSTIFSGSSDYSSPFINETDSMKEWFAVWNNPANTYINLTLSNSPSPSYTEFDLTLKSPISAELELGGNLDIQTAHRQYDVEGSTFFDADSYIGFAYKVSFTAGHYYSVKLGNRDWEPLNLSAYYPYVTLFVVPAPLSNGARFCDPSNYYNPDFIRGSITGFINLIPYYVAATGIHPLTTQDYYVVAVQSSSSNKWIPQHFLIQDEENVWEEFLAANPWFYFFPQVNPWLFLAVVGGIAALIVFVVNRTIKKSKLKASSSTGAKGEFLDEL